MALIVGLKFKHTNKTYYFDPVGIEFAENDGVIVETARGVEFGRVVIPNKEVPDSEIVQPLKPVERKATEKDERQAQKNDQDKEKAIPVVNEKIAKANLPMKLVDAEYTFDRHKLIFYFTADGRVDFRELVRELASIFKVRIELRQIYERDDTKMRGALALCGRSCCCTSHLPDFEKVSIKMAKIQGLSLNPQKISGCCGRLMCCLKYENDYYSEVFKRMPKIGSKVKTKDGEGVVESNDILRQLVTVKVATKDDTIERHTYKLDELGITVRQNVSELSDDDGDNSELKE
jgi:cell fate regulator YaaT (PSP1 superfamily)